ncbi:protein CNPPD1 [Orussus abietinus]|uniref:protein CNPPD1 n=1 Tax=Orussus abietinus TaxID=222816 RepID=UPI000624FCF5|nr:protein CNPPD1 [Orussus abietinus]
MTNISKSKRSSVKFKSIDVHDEFLNRIKQSLYYTKLPRTDCLSLPVTELAAELFTEVRGGHTLKRLDVEEASRVSRNACVSPCSLVLALLYLERLKDCNPEYLQQVAPSELFLVTLMIASKFLHDRGEEDEVYNIEWAQSGNLTLSQVNRLEKEFLNAINWSVYVCQQEFWDRLRRLERDVAYKEASKRGWFSYGELCCLVDSVRLLDVVLTVVNMSSICLATYAAGVVTLLGSALVTSQIPGSLFTPKQSVQLTDALETKLIPILETELPKTYAIPSDDLPIDFLFASLDYNDTCPNCIIETQNATGWEWWLNSVMTWLPVFSALESKSDSSIEDKLNRINMLVTNARSISESVVYVQDPVTMTVELNWKQTPDLDFKFPLRDWRYYMTYVTKISLGPRR